MKANEVRDNNYTPRAASKNVTYAENVCFDHSTWQPAAKIVTPGDNWRDVYLMYQGGTLFMTSHGGGDDLPLVRSNTNC